MWWKPEGIAAHLRHRPTAAATPRCPHCCCRRSGRRRWPAGAYTARTIVRGRTPEDRPGRSCSQGLRRGGRPVRRPRVRRTGWPDGWLPALATVRRSPEEPRSEEHTSELQSLRHLVCRLLLEKKQIEYLIDVRGRAFTSELQLDAG